jgi:hypothetical protein
MKKVNLVLKDFIRYCEEHPKERFWQALRNWAGVGFIWAGDNHEGEDIEDTFYWKGRKKE